MGGELWEEKAGRAQQETWEASTRALSRPLPCHWALPEALQEDTPVNASHELLLKLFRRFIHLSGNFNLSLSLFTIFSASVTPCLALASPSQHFPVLWLGVLARGPSATGPGRLRAPPASGL